MEAYTTNFVLEKAWLLSFKITNFVSQIIWLYFVNVWLISHTFMTFFFIYLYNTVLLWWPLYSVVEILSYHFIKKQSQPFFNKHCDTKICFFYILFIFFYILYIFFIFYLSNICNLYKMLQVFCRAEILESQKKKMCYFCQSRHSDSTSELHQTVGL